MGMRKFEHILRFKPFILRTDSKCIEYLNSLKETRGIYARWLNFMQGFTYQVVHQPGVTNQNADAISRMEDLLETPEDTGEEERLDLEEDLYVLEDGAAEEWTRANPLQQQRADRVLGQVIAWVEYGQRPERGELPEGDPELLTYYGLFGRLRSDVHQGLIYEGIGQGQVCLPSEYFEKVFKWAHQQPTTEHFGITATKRKFRECFYAPGAGRRIV